MITEATARIARLKQAPRGVQLIATMTLVAELQDFLRFGSLRRLTAYVGLVPGEHSSDPQAPSGQIHRAGSSAVTDIA